jgi:hypothetical protein
MPLSITFRVDVYGRPKLQVRLRWFFGLLDKELRKGKKKPEAEKEAVEEKKKPRKKRANIKLVWSLLRTRGLFRKIREFLVGILRQIKIRDLEIDCRVGLDTPADTGLLFAVVGPASVFLSSTFPERIRVQPSLVDETVFEGYLHGAVWLRPVQLAAPVLGFVFSLPALRVVKTLIESKWKKRR